MANFDALNADGEVTSFKSTTDTGVETPHKNAQLMVANAHVTAANPVPISVGTSITNTNPLPVSLNLANAVLSNTNSVPVRLGNPVWTSVWGVSAAPVTSTDMSASPASVTDAPTSGQKIVVDSILVSVREPIAVTFKCETSGAILYGPVWMSGNTAVPVYTSGPGAKGIKLATADKKLQAQTAAAANISILVGYHSEA